MPGVIVTQHSGDGKANQYFLRGFNLDHGTDFATCVDGMPVNMPTHAHGQGYSDLNWLIPELVDRSLPQGPVLRGRRRLLLGRLGAHRPVRRAAARHRLGDARPGPLRARAARRHSRARRRRAALRHRRRAQRRALGEPAEVPPQATACCARAFGDAASAPRSPRWATRRLERDRPDPAARGRRRPDRPLRRARPERRRPDRSATASRSRRRAAGRRRVELQRLRDPLAARTCSPTSPTSSSTRSISTRPINGDQFQQAERRNVDGLAASRRWNSARGGFDTVNTVGLQLRHDRLDPVGLYATVRASAPRRRRRARCARRASACTPRARPTGRRGCAASPACAPTASAST